MLIAFHTKHIMGALSLKAGLPLRVGFIELGRGKMVVEQSFKGADCERSGGGRSLPGRLLRQYP